MSVDPTEAAADAIADAIAEAERTPLLGPARRRAAQAVDAALSTPDLSTSLRGRALLRRAQARLFGGNIVGAGADVVEAGRLLTEDPERDLEAQLLAARLLNRRAQREEAQALVETCRPRARRAGARVRLAFAAAAGELALDRGDRAAAIGHFEATVGLARTEGAPHEELQASLALGLMAQLAARPLDAAGWLAGAATLARQHKAEDKLVEAAMALGNIQIGLGKLDLARASLEEALGTEQVPPQLRPVVHGALARIEMRAGRLDAALQHGLAEARWGAGVENAGAFADGTLQVAQVQLKQGDRGGALDTLATGEGVLRGRGEEEHAELIALERRRVLDAR